MRQEFTNVFGAEQASRAKVVEAPGRVNLIGEHTDYNEGFVFPIAINFAIRIMGAVRDDNIVHAYSADFREGVRFDLNAIASDRDHSWSNYLRGVLKGLREAGYPLRGMDVLVTGDVPQGAGLSSSAAFEVATAFLAQELFDLDLPALDMVRLCQRAENVFVGLNCGIMDQFVSRLGRAGNALLLDCRDLSYSYYPLDPDRASVVVVNSGVKHALVASEYNQRRCECETGVEILKRYDQNIKALRDANQALLQAHLDELGPVVGRRCQHVVAENARTLAAGEALVAGDLSRFGELMYASHASLRDLYGVSCTELDLLVELAQAVRGTLGARMTGGGFGGCTVNLVRPEKVAEFRAVVAAGYKAATGRTPEIYVCTASPGARAVD